MQFRADESSVVEVLQSQNVICGEASRHAYSFHPYVQIGRLVQVVTLNSVPALKRSGRQQILPVAYI